MDDLSARRIWRLVITGGPSAGKTTALEAIRSVYTDRGYQVLVIPETATELIQSGITPWTCQSTLDFQKTLFGLQKAKEEAFFHCPLKKPDCLILLDRGLLDGKAYLSDAEYDQILKAENLDEKAICQRYDAVFHLVSAACGAREAYTLKNNRARFENPEEAAAVEERTQEVWKCHPKRQLIPALPVFEDKIRLLLEAVDAFLDKADPEQESGKEETL